MKTRFLTTIALKELPEQDTTFALWEQNEHQALHKLYTLFGDSILVKDVVPTLEEEATI